MTRTCPQCGKSNRIPFKHLSHAGKCGDCGTVLPAQSVPINVGAAEFQQIIESVQVPILIDFWASWCAPCRMAAPQVEKVAQQMAGKALVLKVDTERVPELAQRYGVSGIPNFIVMKGGSVVKQQAGLVEARQMSRWLEEAQ